MLGRETGLSIQENRLSVKDAHFEHLKRICVISTHSCDTATFGLDGKAATKLMWFVVELWNSFNVVHIPPLSLSGVNEFTQFSCEAYNRKGVTTSREANINIKGKSRFL